MATIKIENLKKSGNVNPQEATEVKGGQTIVDSTTSDGDSSSSSTHTGGVNACFSDGSVRFVK